MKILKLMILAALAILLSGCVGMMDRIPIMGENEDGTKTIVAYASRTRFYTFSKASESIELWKVSSNNGVEMTGSKADSDATSAVQMLRDGIALGRAVYGVPQSPQPQPQVRLYDANGNLCNADGSPCEPNDGGGTGN